MYPNSQPSCSRDIPAVGGGYEPPIKRNLYSSEVLSIWNLAQFTRELGTREQGIAFAVEHGLIAGEKLCRVHRVPMHIDLMANNTVGRFYCPRGKCRGRTRKSRTEGTWFENVKISLPHVYYLMYCFAHRWNQDIVLHEDPFRDELQHCLSCLGIRNCREAVAIYQLERQQEKGKIGGPGKVVQLDESNFGKRKYNKGRRVEGHWVLGLIEDGSEELGLEVPKNTRSADALVPLIQKHVEVRTTIHTDCWKAYDCLDQYGYIHKKVNHSDPDNPFVAEDGTHTHRIESQWRAVKRFFYKENFNHAENFADLIVEYLWRKNN